MICGPLASESSLLSDTADRLQEQIRKKNPIDRLFRHFADGGSPHPRTQFKRDRR
jgi:hypothetical protein